jgi:hypothetical protein
MDQDFHRTPRYSKSIRPFADSVRGAAALRAVGD